MIKAEVELMEQYLPNIQQSKSTYSLWLRMYKDLYICIDVGQSSGVCVGHKVRYDPLCDWVPVHKITLTDE